MIRLILAAVLVFVNGYVSAQDSVLFKVLTVPPGATIGNRPLTPGMDVFNSSSKELVNVPKGTYLGIVTADGYVVRVTKSAKVQKLAMLGGPPGLQVRGSVRVDSDYTHLLPSAPGNSNSLMLSDTLFMYWGDGAFTRDIRQPNKDTVTFRISNLYDTTKMSLRTNRNWVLVGIKRILEKDRALIYEVGKRSQQHLIKLPNEETKSALQEKLRTELSYFQNSPDKLFYELAIYQLNNLILDQHLVVYKIISQQKKPGDSLLGAYFNRLGEEKHFELINLD